MATFLKDQFAEKVGGFANAEGGIIIIGIGDNKPRKIIGLEKIEDGSINVNKIIGNRTNIKLSSCKIREIQIKTNKDESKSCLFLFIPQTKEVVEVINVDDTVSIPLRLGLEVLKKTSKEITKSKKKIYLNNFDHINRIKEFTLS